VNPAREVAQLLQTAVELFSHPAEYGPGAGRVALEPLVQQCQFERGGHESLLRPVVQITLDPPPRLVGRLDEPGARRR
jgi:hypothetical protein